MRCIRNTLSYQKKAMERLGYTAVLMVLLLSLVVLGDLTILTSRGRINSSFEAAHRSNDVMINEPRAEVWSAGAGGAEYFRGRKMKEVKLGVTTGDAEIYSRGSSLGSTSKEDPNDTDTTLNPQDRGQDQNYPVTERSEPQLLNGSQDHPTPQTTPPKLAAAAAEIFRMMNKDYHPKARRRPPINNKQPPANHA